MTKALRLSPHELADQHRSGRVSIVDVREPMEFVGGSIPGSRNIPLSQIGKVALPDAPLVLVCHSGSRSALGTLHLQKAGLSQVANLHGGLRAWEAEGFPIERARPSPT
jgi:rhodanese-related sulfurtransferase